VKPWITVGMFRMGNTNPDRMKVGSMVVRKARRNATVWVRVTVEIRMPCPSAPITNRTMAKRSSG
jgi:hypothetical protein